MEGNTDLMLCNYTKFTETTHFWNCIFKEKKLDYTQKKISMFTRKTMQYPCPAYGDALVAPWWGLKQRTSAGVQQSSLVFDFIVSQLSLFADLK